MTETQDPRSMTPAQVDGQLATLWEREQTYRAYSYQERSRLAEYERQGRTRWAAQAAENLAKYEAVVAEQRALAEPFEAEYTARGGWLRYFLVNNSNGHVHRGMNCTTCFDTTQYNWLVELADCDEAAMVAEYGEMACTVCFPAAPTMTGFGDGTSTLARYSAAEKAERAAAKADRAAKKAEKNLVEPVRVHRSNPQFTETLSTVYAAKTWLKDAVDYRTWGYQQYLTETVEQDVEIVKAALVLKGFDVDTLVTKWEKAARKNA